MAAATRSNVARLNGVGTLWRLEELACYESGQSPKHFDPVDFKEEQQGGSMTQILVRAATPLLAIVAGLAAARGAGIEQQSGRLPELIARLAGRDYVLAAPARDARPYVDPAPVLNAFRHVAAAMAWGDVAVAARQAKEFDYEVVQFTDADTQRDYFVLREDLDVVETIRGWGSYIINPHSRVDALVEVPHPMADLHTPEIGGRVFAACGAKGFLLAGTHRAKADVPDLVDSVFHQVHTAWIGPLAQVTAWQIHGFLSAKHPFPAGTKVVASTGDGALAPEIAALDTALERSGLASYAFNRLPAEGRDNQLVNGSVPGLTFTSLAAAKNEQGRLSRSLGGSFVHIELEGDVRATASRRAAVSLAIANVIRDAAGLAASNRGAAQRAPQSAAARRGPGGWADEGARAAEKPPIALAARVEGDADQPPAERIAAQTPMP
ncbi:MAG: hypothetical protein IT424_10450 [Pirellulales bacterium]|nr:hypothetical protein [Pirellulales bacterium]